MAQKSFFLNHSDNENEVILYLGITSILQHEFNTDTELFIQTSSDLSSLINKFNWKKIPATGTRDKKPDETGLENVPSHLLKVQIQTFDVIVSQAWTIAEFIHSGKSVGTIPTFYMTYVHSGPSSDWISLNEANDALIAHWYRYRNDERELTLLEVKPGGQQDEWRKAALKTDVFIINKISPITSQFIKLVRTLNPSVKMIFHAFESPSVYFAGTYLYGLQEFLYEEDLWLMSCEADLELAKKSFEKINAEVLPLRIPDKFVNSEIIENSLNNLYYVGRISEQKNIHEMLMAISLIKDDLRNSGRKLKIIGYEDFLGLPNLRIPSTGYLEFLYRFAGILQISDLVEFHPAIPQDQIIAVISNGVFISTSVHSDENFGLVAFRALNAGIPVILSEWGGHRDFSKYFTGIEYVRIFSSEKVPHANPFEIAEKILKIWDGNKPRKTGFKPKRISLSLSDPQNRLRPTRLKIEIEKRLKNSFPWIVRKWPLYGKIFSSFADKRYRLAMTVYGAKERKKSQAHQCALSPLAKVSEKEITVVDCSFGKLKYPRKEDPKNIPLIQLGTKETVYVSLPEWEWLWDNGVVYRKGDL